MGPIGYFQGGFLVLFEELVDQDVLLLLLEPVDVVSLLLGFRPYYHQIL